MSKELAAHEFLIPKLSQNPLLTVFRKNLIWSAAVHIGVIILLVMSVKFFNHSKPMEPIQWIDLAPNLGPTPSSTLDRTSPKSSLPQETRISPSLPKSTTALTPIPQPVIPEPRSLVSQPAKTETSIKTKPEEPKSLIPRKILSSQTPTIDQNKNATHEKPKVILSTRKVTRTLGLSQSKSSSKTSSILSGPFPFNTSTFEKSLLTKLFNSGDLVAAKGAIGSGTSAKGQPNDFAWYFNHIFQEMYHAWQTPFGLADGLHTQVLLRVEKSGMISKVSLASSSGNQLMDESALAAANHVKKLQPLPKGLGDSYAEITVTFKIQKL